MAFDVKGDAEGRSIGDTNKGTGYLRKRGGMMPFAFAVNKAGHGSVINP